MSLQRLTEAEPRYDSETLRKVTSLAQELETRHQETFSASQIEAAGREVGLDPAFIQQALSQVTTDAAPAPLDARQREFRALVGGWGGAAAWAALVYLLDWMVSHIHGAAPLGTFLTFFAAAPAAGVFGYLSGKARSGRAAGVLLAFLLVPSVIQMLSTYDPDAVAFVSIWAVFAPLLGAWLGWQGGKIRDHYHPLSPETPPTVSRPALLKLLFSLQEQLEGQKRRHAFLSIDVVGSSEMKRSATDLAVEYSFTRFREWVETIVRGAGGQVQSAAGDGLMCVFPADAQAVRAARGLLEGLAGFNAEQNRLSLPFRIRCGVSAGDVAMDHETPIGHLQSPVIDRSAALQKGAEAGQLVVGGEAAAAALIELGEVQPVPGRPPHDPAFTWGPPG